MPLELARIGQGEVDALGGVDAERRDATAHRAGEADDDLLTGSEDTAASGVRGADLGNGCDGLFGFHRRFGLYRGFGRFGGLVRASSLVTLTLPTPGRASFPYRDRRTARKRPK